MTGQPLAHYLRYITSRSVGGAAANITIVQNWVKEFEVR